VPDFLGDDARPHGHPRHNNSVSRPTPDDGHTLIWNARRDAVSEFLGTPVDPLDGPRSRSAAAS
jgi:hypothetical protein